MRSSLAAPPATVTHITVAGDSAASIVRGLAETSLHTVFLPGMCSSIPASYVQMPNCTHGYFEDGEATFDAAFDFLRKL